MSQPKGMTSSEINSRVKKSCSYINLKPNQIVHIVSQLSLDQQKKCFSKAKKVEPLDKVETAGIIALHGIAPANTPISKMKLADRRKLIKAAWGKNKELTSFLAENNLEERAKLLELKELPGDFSPRSFWELLDGIVKDLDLSNPDDKDD